MDSYLLNKEHSRYLITLSVAGTYWGWGQLQVVGTEPQGMRWVVSVASPSGAVLRTDKPQSLGCQEG